VPFSLPTQGTEAPDVIFRWLGLEPLELSEGSGEAHRHEVVQFRHPAIQRARRAVIHSRAYPWVRRTLGPARIRRVRAALTKSPDVLTTEEALSSCTPAQRE